MAGTRIWSVVVARCDLTAKSRLAPVLTDVERSQLALAMLADVLDAAVHARLGAGSRSWTRPRRTPSPPSTVPWSCPTRGRG